MDRHGPVEVKALHIAAAVALEETGLLSGLNALGDQGHSKGAHHLNHVADNDVSFFHIT